MVRFWKLLPFFLAAALGFLVGSGLDQVYLRHVGHDQAWCLYAADLVLGGVKLNGPELIEVNPPFIIWFSAIPVLLGKLAGLGILNGFRMFFDGVTLLMIGWTTALLRKLYRPGVTVLLLLLCAQVITHFWLIGKDSLGQREHLLVLFLLPYLVLAGARWCGKSTGRAQEVLVGASAAIAICLKPQHLLVVLLVELSLLIRSRSRRSLFEPVVVTFAVSLGCYLIAVVSFGRRYIETTMPLLRVSYWGLNEPYYKLFLDRTAIAVGVAIVVGWILYFSLQSRIRFSSLVGVFGVAAVGSMVAYIQQHKGWSYQLIPAGMFGFLFIVTMFIGLAEDRFTNESGNIPSLRALAVVTILCAMISAAVDLRFGERTGYFNEKKRDLAEFYSTYPSGSAVAYIATQPWEMPLVIEQGKTLGQRTNYFWLLPAIILGQEPGNASQHAMSTSTIEALSSYQRGTMAQDLAHWKPSIVVIDQCGPDLCDDLRLEGYGTVLGWFSRDTKFASEWKHYAPAGKKGDLEAFRRLD